MKTFRIVLLGTEGVGKTSLLHRLLTGSFDINPISSVADLHAHNFCLSNGLHQQIEIMDTSKIHEYPAMRELYIRSGDAFIVSYAINSKKSFLEAKITCELIRKVKGKDFDSMILVGNKIDLIESRCISTELALKTAISMKCSLVETSSKLNLNVKCPFTILFNDYIISVHFKDTNLSPKKESNKSLKPFNEQFSFIGNNLSTRDKFMKRSWPFRVGHP